MRMRAALLLSLASAVLGGCQTIEYGPIGGEITPVFGYEESQTGEGEFILKIVALAGAPELVHAMWDRRARELCGAEFQKKLYRAERPTTTYGYYGGAPGNMILEGFLQCGAAVTASASSAGS